MDVVVALIAVTVSGVLGWPVTAAFLQIATSRDAAGIDTIVGSDPAPSEAAEREVLRGGLWIGILERLAVTIAILAGYPEAIAFVIAVKGLGRFAELKNTVGAAERFIIGTLASLLWATAIGVLTRWLFI
ncbi:hypothetical protein LWF01_04890 [Saxibacter everestensis]|uniref:MAPEG family protein n=1 Tax=Saxibacter everestensis TaxID=2909229 RepID=A0ABY8QVR1_9MICO|nr:hypothetical protein LWF01_04890 [Brevibacteriaceae bacterium ZFBP1038]